MKKKKILVVEDSAFFRKVIIDILEEDERFEVVAYARNGLEALEKMKTHEVDAITLDLEMPEMNGVEFLEKVMTTKPRPIMILSSKIEEDEEIGKYCIRKGAKDIFQKDEMIKQDNVREEFLDRLEKVATSNVEKKIAMELAEEKKEFKLLIIGSSTGGPKALHSIVDYLEKDFPIPVIIVQHMANGFTKSLAEKLDTTCSLPVKEIERGDKLENGKVYVAPAGYQTKLEKVGEEIILNVSKDYSEDLYKPSVDKTILSSTRYFDKDLMVVILTGMGEDGKEACKEVKKNGGFVIAESEETAVVYGMPKAVIDAGLSDKVLPLHKIYPEIRRKIK